MPRWRKLRTWACRASGCSAAVRRSALARFAVSTSSSSKICSVASAARQASGLPVYECECRKPRVTVAAVEGLVDFVARHHQRQRQVAAADALGKAQEIRPHAPPARRRRRCRCGRSRPRFRRGSGAPSSGRTVRAPASGTAGSCIAMPVAHCTSGSMMMAAICSPRSANRRSTSAAARAPRRPPSRPSAALALRRVRRHHRLRGAQQRAVASLNSAHVGDGQRADGLAVVSCP